MKAKLALLFLGVACTPRNEAIQVKMNASDLQQEAFRVVRGCVQADATLTPDERASLLIALDAVENRGGKSIRGTAK